jgi:PAS domain S-box-containing protein
MTTKKNDCKSCSKIAEAKGQLQQYKRYKKYFEQIINHTLDTYYRRNLKTDTYDFISPGTEQLTGFTLAELASLSFNDMIEKIHPDDRGRLLQLVKEALQKSDQQSTHLVEYRLKHKNGRYRWVRENFSVFFDKNGKAHTIIGTAYDITEIKELYENLKNAEERYRTLYNNARVALYRTRIADGRVLECNQTMARMLGYDTPQQCLEEFVLSKAYIDPFFRPKLLEELKKNPIVPEIEAAVRRKDGSICWIRFSAKIYPDLGYLEGAAWDITAAKLLTQTEMKVLTMVMQGLSSAQIAKDLYRSIRTIEDQRANIMHKLDVANLVDLTKRAIQMGITAE